MISAIPVMFVGGILYAIMVSPLGLNGAVIESIQTAVLAPIIEESAKVLAVILLAGSIRNAREGVLAGICVGLGFAFFENILYFMSSEGNPVLFIRPLNMALHIVAPALMGYFIGSFRSRGIDLLVVANVLGIGILIHAFWNGFIVTLPKIAGIILGWGMSEDAFNVLLTVYIFGAPVILSLLVLVLLVLKWQWSLKVVVKM